MNKRDVPLPKAGDRVSYEIEALLGTGEGKAGRARVAGGFPGERVLARIEHVGKQATYATAQQVERGRAGRRRPPCARHSVVAGRCTGCALMALNENVQRTLLKEVLAEQYGLEVDAVDAAPEPLGYRWSAKRIAFGGPGTLKLGSFIRGSHHPANMANCLVDHPLLAAAADEIALQARILGITAHDERDGNLGLRAVWLRTDGKQVLTTLVTSHEDERLIPELASKLTRSDGVAWSIHPEGGNALRGEHAVILRGIEQLTVFGTTVGPLGFLQPNPVMAERMYDWLVEGIGEGHVFDLYAGSGATTRRLREVATEVTPCESNTEAAGALGVEPETAEDFMKRQQSSPSGIVANPPRRGLGEVVVGEILRLAPARVHIMACGPAGLKRDLTALAQAYELESLRAFDTLPQTPHVELIAKLVRR